MPHPNKVLTADQIVEMCERYQSGESCVTLGRFYGVCRQAIWTMLKRRGIATRQSIDYKRYTADYAFFQNIDTGEKAYWLGFLAADGCVTGAAGSVDGKVKITLASKDREHIQRFLTTLKATQPIYDWEDKVKHKKLSTVVICSVKMCRDLARYGVVRRKTAVFTWPESLPKNMISHFVRGYFDGDGSVFTCKPNNAPSQDITISVLGHEPFIARLQEELMRECNLGKTKLKRRSPGKPYFYVRYTGRLQILRMAAYMYKDAAAWLPRKRDKFQPFILGTVPNGILIERG